MNSMKLKENQCGSTGCISLRLNEPVTGASAGLRVLSEVDYLQLGYPIIIRGYLC